MTTIASNLQAIHTAIAASAHEAGRDLADITLLAVSKNFPADSIRVAYHAGQLRYAENYLQEALAKMGALHELPLEWHFIGPIQSNKTRAIAENFSWVHSVDRLIIAERLSAQRPAHLPPLQVCIQVNISGEASKSGASAESALQLAIRVAQLPRLQLRGLMAVPAPSNDLQEQRKSFAALRELLARLNQHGLLLDTLSMGMTHDYAAAIMEGSTMLRIGTAIFGNRT